MNAVLWKVGTKFTAQKGANAGRECIKLVFRELDTNKEYKANLPTSMHDWMRYVQEGNVFYGLTVNPEWNTINYYQGFTRVEVKPVNKVETKTDASIRKEKPKDSNGNEPFPGQVSLF